MKTSIKIAIFVSLLIPAIGYGQTSPDSAKEADKPSHTELIQTQCKLWALEDEISAKELDEYIADCVAEELADTLQRKSVIDDIRKQCRAWAFTDEITEADYDKYMFDCVAEELSGSEDPE